MSDCECLPTCIFFNDKMSQKPASANLFKKSYCLGDNAQCARYRVFKTLGRGTVPADLYPNDLERSEQIIQAHAKPA